MPMADQRFLWDTAIPKTRHIVSQQMIYMPARFGVVVDEYVHKSSSNRLLRLYIIIKSLCL
jgi:hypothetical protein